MVPLRPMMVGRTLVACRKTAETSKKILCKFLNPWKQVKLLRQKSYSGSFLFQMSMEVLVQANVQMRNPPKKNKRLLSPIAVKDGR